MGAPNKRRVCGCWGDSPVKRGLVTAPELWRWSSYRLYAFGDRGPVNMEWFFPPYVMRRTKPRHFGEPDDGTATILKAHPANTAQSAAPRVRYRKGKTKAII